MSDRESVEERRRGRAREVPCVYCVRRIARDPRWKCHDALIGQYGAESYHGTRCSECITSHATCHSIPSHTDEIVQVLTQAAEAAMKYEMDHGTLALDLQAAYEAAIGPVLEALEGYGIQPSQKLALLKKSNNKTKKRRKSRKQAEWKADYFQPAVVREKRTPRSDSNGVEETNRRRTSERRRGRRLLHAAAEEDDDLEENAGALLTGRAAERVLNEILGYEEGDDEGRNKQAAYFQVPVSGARAPEPASDGHARGGVEYCQFPVGVGDDSGQAMEEQQQQQQQYRALPPAAAVATYSRAVFGGGEARDRDGEEAHAVGHVHRTPEAHGNDEEENEDDQRLEMRERRALRRRKVAALESLAHTTALLLAEIEGLNRLGLMAQQQQRAASL
ncbi:unnamed protein product [Discula destructiva]